MGYIIYFDGAFTLDKPLTSSQINYLRKFASTRRMKRNNNILVSAFSDPIRQEVNLPIGLEDAYFVGFEENDDINIPPPGQPNLLCHWIPNPDGSKIL